MTVQGDPLDFNGTPPGSRAHAATRMSVAQLANMLEDRIADLARELLGEPNRELSSAQTLRFGTKGSVAMEIDGANKGRWYDHEHGAGGAGLELIGYHLGLDDKAAWDWARSWLGEPDAGPSWTATPPAPPARSASGSSSARTWRCRGACARI
ncbi:ATPase [Oceaniovalibus guishaninsula JLT2003]|uniref:ATPase n=1 Tax=Oceaniovalibus guishaninsula JLT2003 TaxID=1231392 RepID=K2HQ28_9RHOB|nr:ATPase [Oceaniovalibus guishaninsula JLT2003]